jgi:hypothetical protein
MPMSSGACARWIGHRAVGLLLEGDGEDAVVHPGMYERRGDECGGASDASRGVHPEHRLSRSAEGVGQVELRHHHPLEHVGGLADHDGVDVGEPEVGVLERAERRLAHDAGDGEITALRGVMRLPDADDRAALAHAPPSRTQTRFCWRQGPEVA